MSQYQYYEFQTVDRPLTDEEQETIGSLSSRVALTPKQAIFTYSYSDLPANSEAILTEYFDAMLYLANWGTRQLMFRFPKPLVDLTQMRLYCVEDYVSLSVTGDSVVLNIEFHEEGGFWVEGEGWLSSLIRLRDDILKQDYRVLYLVWLSAITLLEEQEIDELACQPPVPPGLRELSRPLRDFAELFEVDEYLIQVAAEWSEDQKAVPEEMLHEAIAKLSREECNAFLLRLARGESHISVEVNKRLHELVETARSTSHRDREARRTARQLLDAADQERERQRKRQAQEAEAKRIKELEALSQEEPQLWQNVHALIQKSQANAYKEAVQLLLNLREVAAYRGKEAAFQEQIEQLCEQYRRRSSLLARLRQAGLLQE